jgi:hypothetical protein
MTARLPKPLLLALTLCALAAAFALRAQPASAAACAADLQVAGIPVTGSDCTQFGDGRIKVTAPKLLGGGAVNITTTTGAVANMVISLDKTSMVGENPGVPLRVNVGTNPVAAGGLTVGKFQVCDLAPAQNVPPTGTISPLVGSGGGLDDVVPAEVGCRITQAIKLDASSLSFAGNLVGLGLDTLKNRPLILGLDDVKGGRVFGTFAIKLPASVVGDHSIRVGVGAEFSKDQGFKPTSLAAQINDARIPLIVPGVFLQQAGLSYDTSLNRLSAQAQVVIVPIKFLITSNLSVQNGSLQQLGANLVFQPPLHVTNSMLFDSFGFNFQAGGSVTLPTGGTVTAPARLSGSTSFLIGPPGISSLPGTPENLAKLIRGFVTVTVGGPQVNLHGDLFAFGTAVKLGSANVLVSSSPFRFEASATVDLFKSSSGFSALQFLHGNVFLGIGDSGAFTALGQVSVKVPDIVPVVGGAELGGVQALISNKAAAAVLTIDPPLLPPFTGGAAFVFNGLKFELISDLTPFITVTPTASSARVKGERPVVHAADLKNLQFPGGLAGAIVRVDGAGKPPSAVKFTPPSGKAQVVKLSTTGNSAYYGIAKPAAGGWQVSSPDAITSLTVSRIDPTPYLDPAPGWGSRPRGKVIAGNSVPVCWHIKHAPADASVDIFEDQNGHLGTGRTLAEGLGTDGCFSFSTAGLEPGKHWVYGVVRSGGAPLSARYWPIGIDVLDPHRLPGPSGVKVKATDDGAQVTFKANPQAAGYVVRATQVDEDADPVQATVGALSKPGVKLSLRGARRWSVQVQAFDLTDAIGNPSKTKLVSPSKPLIASGTPNGAAVVGKRWAFQLNLGEGVRAKRLAGPSGLTVSSKGLARWRPSKAAAALEPQVLRIRACLGKRCVIREFKLSAYATGTAPGGPARGFQVAPNVVSPRGGDTITIYAQGIDEHAVVKIDGHAVRGVKKLNELAVEVKTPRLKPGPHDVSLRIGGDAEELKRGAIVALR